MKSLLIVLTILGSFSVSAGSCNIYLNGTSYVGEDLVDQAHRIWTEVITKNGHNVVSTESESDLKIVQYSETNIKERDNKINFVRRKFYIGLENSEREVIAKNKYTSCSTGAIDALLGPKLNPNGTLYCGLRHDNWQKQQIVKRSLGKMLKNLDC